MGNTGNRLIIGQRRLSGSAEELVTDGSLNGMVSIAIKALSTNTGPVYIGTDDTVTSADGFELTAGQALSVDLLNGSSIYVVGTADDVVCYMGLMP